MWSDENWTCKQIKCVYALHCESLSEEIFLTWKFKPRIIFNVKISRSTVFTHKKTYTHVPNSMFKWRCCSENTRSCMISFSLSLFLFLFPYLLLSFPLCLSLSLSLPSSLSPSLPPYPNFYFLGPASLGSCSGRGMPVMWSPTPHQKGLKQTCHPLILKVRWRMIQMVGAACQSVSVFVDSVHCC